MLLCFDGASNLQLGGNLLKCLYPKLKVMRGFEHIVSILFNDLSKIPNVNQMVQYHKALYNTFGSDIFHKSHSILKSKYLESHNDNIDLFSRNYTKMVGYFMVMNRDLRIAVSDYISRSILFFPIIFGFLKRKISSFLLLFSSLQAQGDP